MNIQPKTTEDWRDRCYPLCGCDQLTELLVHYFDLDLTDDYWVKYPSNTEKRYPTTPNKLATKAHQVVYSHLIRYLETHNLSYVNQSTGLHEGWHYRAYCGVRNLLRAHGVPPPIAHSVLPPLDYNVFCRCHLSTGEQSWTYHAATSDLLPADVQPCPWPANLPARASEKLEHLRYVQYTIYVLFINMYIYQ